MLLRRALNFASSIASSHISMPTVPRTNGVARIDIVPSKDKKYYLTEYKMLHGKYFLSYSITHALQTAYLFHIQGQELRLM